MRSNKILARLWTGLAASFLMASAASAAGGATPGFHLAQSPGEPGEGQPPGGATNMGQPGSLQGHVQEAMKHAKAAATSGHKGDASSISKHAQMAQTHVQAALKDNPDNPHLQAAQKSLDEAIAQGNQSNAENARKAAHDAVTHLKALK